MIEIKEFAARRKKLLQQLGKENAAILFSSNEMLRNGDVHFPYRQDSDFYYLTGFQEPDAVAFFLPNRKEGEFVLFNRSRDPLMERWLGKRSGQEGACEIYGADQAFDIRQLDEKAKEILLGRKTLYYHLGKSRQCDKKLSQWVQILQALDRKGCAYPLQLASLSYLTGSMRLCKSEYELGIMRKVSDISAVAHRKLMETCRPGLFEYELAALFEYEIKIQNCQSTAYGTIVGGGENACVLHYVDNNHVLQEGDLVLIDAGAEYENYASDITRTFPVSGKFTRNQAAIYQLVLDTQLAVINLVKPGIPWNLLQETAASYLTKGLIELGILPGPHKQAIENKSYQDYYMHNIGHWLGLDVHDAGSYKVNDKWRILEPGMVLTVEPGLYFSANDQLDAAWWNIGVRIEDDVLVTKDGCEVLTEKAPKTISDIEKIMGHLSE